MSDSTIKAVLGPTNTGKTHLAIERMCAHSSGAIGFPLRLLAREVYDRVVAIKGESQVALITGEERIAPPGARYFLCTAEAMPRLGGGPDGPLAFVALDEAQLAANPERGHIFTDRLLNTRGREETMLLGSATLEPLVRALLPGAEIIERPRFSTLTYAGAAKLSRLPPRSAIVAFSAEQVYGVAEMLRRFRGGAAVVMGALSPATRNKQVELFQSGEVDYIVATDAIGMGLNLDVHHVAFAGLSKFDGHRQRRLEPAEMAQIAGRAGRHQRDGSFGTMSGGRGQAEFTEEEIYAIEEHRFAPLTHLYWREAEPRFDSLERLIAELERPPQDPRLRTPPQAIDLSVLKRLAEEPETASSVTSSKQVERFWQVCQLPDFRQLGVDQHARLVARLWQDLRGGYLGADFIAGRIAQLDNVQGDIDTLQGRIAAIRNWAYAAQRPDWVLARDEMAARARAVEARLSDALHARLAERFINRRTAVLMKTLGRDPRLLDVRLSEEGDVLVEGQAIGRMEGFRFTVDHRASHADRKLLLAAAEKHLPRLLAIKARSMTTEQMNDLTLRDGAIFRDDEKLATLSAGKSPSRPLVTLEPDAAKVPEAERSALQGALEQWLGAQLAPLAPLRALEEAAENADTPGEVRALLHSVIEGAGFVRRDASGLGHVPAEHRKAIWRLGIAIGALDIFVPALLKPAPRALLHAIGADHRPLAADMQSVKPGDGRPPSGYRRAGDQYVRVDVAEKILRAAHDRRKGALKDFVGDLSLGISVGLRQENLLHFLRDAGFRAQPLGDLAEGAYGPPAPARFNWKPPRAGSPNRERQDGKRDGQRDGQRGKGRKPAGKPPRAKAQDQRREQRPAPRPEHSAFAGLADLLKQGDN